MPLSETFEMPLKGIKENSQGIENLLLRVSLKKKTEIWTAEQIFFGITCAIMAVECASAIYNLLCKFDYFKILKKAEWFVTLILYGFLIACSIVAIVNSILELKRIKKQEGVTLKRCMEGTNIVSQGLWMSLSVISIIMLTCCENDNLRLVSLCLCLLAPLLEFVSTALRCRETLKEWQNTKNTDTTKNQKELTKIRKVKFAVSVITAVFAIFHFMCHVFEATALQGNSHHKYEFANISIIALELFLCCAFIIAFAYSTILEKREEALCTKEESNSLLYKFVRPVGNTIDLNINKPQHLPGKASVNQCLGEENPDCYIVNIEVDDAIYSQFFKQTQVS